MIARKKAKRIAREQYSKDYELGIKSDDSKQDDEEIKKENHL